MVPLRPVSGLIGRIKNNLRRRKETAADDEVVAPASDRKVAPASRRPEGGRTPAAFGAVEGGNPH